MVSRFMLVAGIGLFIIGCAPIPHYELIAPEIKGTIVVSDGVSLDEVSILECQPRSNLRCDSYTKHGVKSDGSFLIPASESFRLFTVLGDALFQWGFNIEMEGKVYSGYKDKSYGLVVNHPRKVTCDLTKISQLEENSSIKLCL